MMLIDLLPLAIYLCCVFVLYTYQLVIVFGFLSFARLLYRLKNGVMDSKVLSVKRNETAKSMAHFLKAVSSLVSINKWYNIILEKYLARQARCRIIVLLLLWLLYFYKFYLTRDNTFISSEALTFIPFLNELSDLIGGESCWPIIDGLMFYSFTLIIFIFGPICLIILAALRVRMVVWRFVFIADIVVGVVYCDFVKKAIFASIS